MSDAALRAAERSYAQNPCEPGLLEALIRARRRLGLGVDHLLEVHSYSARQVSSRLKLRISVLALNGRELEVGTTGKTGVEVPAHRRLLVRPTPCKLDAALLVELREQGLEGISLERSRVSDEDLRLLADTPGLRWLSLRSCSQITNRALACLAEVARVWSSWICQAATGRAQRGCATSPPCPTYASCSARTGSGRTAT